MYKRLIQYEFIQLLRGVFTPVFGIAFPVFMLVLISASIRSETGVNRDIMLVSVFITLMQIIPLAVGFMGFSLIYAQELEQKIPFRLRLFGIKDWQILFSKIVSLLILYTIGYVIYVLAAIYYVKIPNITLINILILYAILILEFTGLVILGYAICLYFKKFGPAYAVVMVIYFGIMIISGMMGIRENNMPDIIQKLTRILPFPYVSFDFYKIFFDQSYNFMPFIQSMIFFLGFVSILCIAVVRFKGTKND